MDLKDLPLEVLVSMSTDINKEISKKRYRTNYKCKPTSLLIRGHTITRGSKNKNSKLTEKDVVAIRQRYLDGDTQKDIAKDYKVRGATISDIIRGHSWFYIEELKKEVETKFNKSKRYAKSRAEKFEQYKQIALDMCRNEGTKIWELNYLELARRAGRTWDARDIMMKKLRKAIEFELYEGYSEKEVPIIKQPRREFIKSCFWAAAVQDAKREGIWAVETLPLEHEVRAKFSNYYKKKGDLLKEIEFYVYSGYKDER